MKKIQFLKLVIALGVVVMLISFAIVPDEYPWYYEVLLFNTGLWPWLIAKRELKKWNTQQNSNLRTNTSKTQNWISKTGIVLMLIGVLSIFPENETWLHTALQISFVVGCVLYLLNSRLTKTTANSTNVIAMIMLLTIPASLSAQNYNQPVKAFESSFQQKDISIIKPFLSDSLKFEPLPIQNTIQILTNIITQLPKLNSLQIQYSESKKAFVKYDFEQLGISESTIHFDANGMINSIEFVENLIQQQIEQQRKMQSSIQVPQPDKIDFTYSKRTIEFPSKDGLVISADLYEVDPNKPVILLCHQAGYNKYEYADIAPRLNKMGFNALAIDQRSGGTFANKPNETYKKATERGIEDIDFTDAIQDIEAAIDFLANKYQKKVIVWGSSYSSALALHIAENNKNVKAVISFSPGDYFGDKLPSLTTVIPKIEQPFWVTSSKEESQGLNKLLINVEQTSLKMQFIPESDGFHGSRALWIGQKGAEEYWDAVMPFLKNNLKK